MWLDNRPLLYSQQAASKTDDKSVKSKDAAADKASVIQPTVKLSKVRFDLLIYLNTQLKASGSFFLSHIGILYDACGWNGYYSLINSLISGPEKL